jgi:hypothetical protein
MSIMRSKAAPFRLDTYRTRVCASRSCVVTAGGVNRAAPCRILRCTTGSSAVIRERTHKTNLIALCAK